MGSIVRTYIHGAGNMSRWTAFFLASPSPHRTGPLSNAHIGVVGVAVLESDGCAY